MILFAMLPFSLHAATFPHRDADVFLDAATGKFRCIYCDKEFGRGDVCRKHMLNCIKKSTEAVVPELRRGRKPKACEACFTSKVSCDKGQPCSRCLLRHLPCRPRDVAEELSPSASPSAPDTLKADTSSQPGGGGGEGGGDIGSVSSSRADARVDESMGWIKNLINPRAASMLEHMANDTSVVTERIPDMSFLSGGAGDDLSAPPQAQATSSDMPSDLMELYPWNYATMLDDAMFNFGDAEDFNMLSLDEFPSVPGLSPSFSSSSSASSSEGMEDTSLLLVNALHDLHNELCTGDPTYSEPFDVQAVSTALSATNLRRFAATFFRLSHVHFPIVHIPSFRSTSSRSLLLSLVIQGAFRSPPLDDVLTTRGLLRLAEEYVFRELQDSLALGTTRLPTTPTLEALQAALVIVYLLAINNSVSSRRQSRVRRIPELAWAVRHLDLMNVRHMPDEDWQLFIYRETCIRVATWTAVADWHQCGMFRCMPIMATIELNCNHPCSTAVWDAADDAEFALAMAQERRFRNTHRSPSSASCSTSSSSTPGSVQSNIRQFIDVLMADVWNRVEQCPRDSYNIHDLATAIVALSNVAITADIMSIMPFTAPALLRSLARWQDLWKDLTSELEREKRINPLVNNRYNSTVQQQPVSE
ncbi:Fungal transcriptional regulatory protein [Cordyceps javanica]|uniref:Fungal transcriptional regulatory protein n=1 Tax=Cordyceps javanica TaxID=43265 RepID=A0A545V849_9HYPO|nr:Fungal transcriptional regulatory protein [Cordyceps javanica]